jgi:hypothetical protein
LGACENFKLGHLSSNLVLVLQDHIFYSEMCLVYWNRLPHDDVWDFLLHYEAIITFDFCTILQFLHVLLDVKTISNLLTIAGTIIKWFGKWNSNESYRNLCQILIEKLTWTP